LLNKSLLKNLGVTLVAPFLFFACASGGLNEAPAALPKTLPKDVNVDVQWWHILGDEFSAKAFGNISPTVASGYAYTSVVSGEIVRIGLDGQVESLGVHPFEVTAPIAIEQNQLVILDAQGQVTLTQLNLDEIWSTKLNSISVEPALITGDRIFVQTIDGRINAIERITGRLLWSYKDAEPSLTVSGTSTPVEIDTASGKAVVTGLANGKLVALSVVDGSIIWEYRITRASGKTDVSRLVDVDAQVTNLGDRIIATAYQGDLVVVDNHTGQVRQAKPFSSYRSVQADGNVWYGVNAQSHIVAFDATTLEELWVNTELEYRQLSEILVSGEFVVVTDQEGFLHVIDKENGVWSGSRHIDWRGANSNPVAFGSGVLMQGHSTRIKFVELTR
jgi:outer membrane protein assembly factor BamB